jgi:hypothetical protein
MKYLKISLSFFIALFFIGCGSSPKIVQREYTDEKMVLANHRFAFDFHLENIGSSGKIYDLINSLIYSNKGFDEYIEYKERSFAGNINEADYPSTLNDDGTEYLYNWELIEKYTIVFNNDTHIIFEYNTYAYSAAAHGSSLIRYYIIDIAEERILDINDLIYPLPDDLLKRIIESNYDINSYFRENIWPPSTVNFSNKNIELLWDAYEIAAYSYGTIRIEIQDEIIDQYLTDKGKTLKRMTAASNQGRFGITGNAGL